MEAEEGAEVTLQGGVVHARSDILTPAAAIGPGSKMRITAATLVAGPGGATAGVVADSGGRVELVGCTVLQPLTRVLQASPSPVAQTYGARADEGTLVMVSGHAFVEGS